MTNEELERIQRRNKERRQRKARTTPGDWLYDSFAFVDAIGDSPLPRAKQMGILVRPRPWFDKLIDSGGLDYGLDPKDLQPYHDADFIVNSHNDEVEDEVDALLDEVRRLKQGATH